MAGRRKRLRTAGAALPRSNIAANPHVSARPAKPVRAATLYEVIEPPVENRPCGGKYGDVIQAIGNTPLVELKRLSPTPGVRIYAKLESHNPTGSVKDRVARGLTGEAEERGGISPGQRSTQPT